MECDILFLDLFEFEPSVEKNWKGRVIWVMKLDFLLPLCVQILGNRPNVDAEKYNMEGMTNTTSDNNNYSSLKDEGIMTSDAKSYSVKASGQVLSLRNRGPIMLRNSV